MDTSLAFWAAILGATVGGFANYVVNLRMLRRNGRVDAHTALLIKYGWPEFQIVRRLGWKDSKMLHRTYGHLFPNHDDALILDLERRLQEGRSRAETELNVSPGWPRYADLTRT